MTVSLPSPSSAQSRCVADDSLAQAPTCTCTWTKTHGHSHDRVCVYIPTCACTSTSINQKSTYIPVTGGPFDAGSALCTCTCI